MKLMVCESCEAEFQIKHTMDENFYEIKLCPFCGDGLDEELKDDIEWEDEDED